MNEIQVSVKSPEKASRLELFIRFIWGTIVGIVLGIIGMFVYIALVIQWFHILLLGKKNPSLAKFINAWLVTVTELNFYVMLATDERPPVIPKF